MSVRFATHGLTRLKFAKLRFATLESAKLRLTKLGSALSLSLVCTVPSFALEPLNDTDLSQKTAQDGVTVTIDHGGTIELDSIHIIDTDGIRDASGTPVSIKPSPTTTIGMGNAGGLGINFKAGAAVKLCTDNITTCTTNNQKTIIIIDVEGGSAAGSADAFVNANLKTGVKAIDIPIESISLLGNRDNTKRSTWNNDVDIVSFKADAADITAGTDKDGIQVSFTNEVAANIQLGNQPQGSIIVINSNTADINIGKMTLYSYNSTAPSNASGATAANKPSSKMSTKVNIKGMTHPDIRIGIDDDEGMWVAMPGQTSITKVSINDTTFGSTAAATAFPATTFNGLKNAAIGNLTLDDIKIQNLKVAINGL